MTLERDHQEQKQFLYSEYLGSNYLLSEEQFSDLSMGILATVGFLHPAQDWQIRHTGKLCLSGEALEGRQDNLNHLK